MQPLNTVQMKKIHLDLLQNSKQSLLFCKLQFTTRTRTSTITALTFAFALSISALSCKKENPVPEQKPETESTLATEMLKSGSGLRIGASVANITPTNTNGLNMEGYEPRQSTGVNDKLSSRCIIIADNSTIIALIALDVIGISKNECDELKSRIEKATGLQKENIFIHAIHTHSAPSMLDGMLNVSFLSTLYENTSEASVRALKSIENAKAIVRSGHSDVETVNRRNPDRRVENEFTTIEFHNKEGQNVASLLNFGCHPVILGPNNHRLSADYVHYLREAVEYELGGTAVFFNGSLGNINPARINEGNAYDPTFVS